MADPAAGLPPGAENDDRSLSIVIYASFMVAITVTSLGLRFVSRGLVQRGQRFWWDDWVALLSLPFILALMATILGMVKNGLGKRIAFVPEEDVGEFLKILFAGYFAYDIAIALTKCSALLFFSRLFPRNQCSTWFNVCLYSVHAMNGLWLVGILLGTIFTCRPIAKNWNPALPGHCGPPSDLWIGSAVPSAFIDFLILLLPLPKIWSLKLSKPRRIGIICVFLLGYCVVIVSIGRLVTTFLQADLMDADITYEMPPVLFWVGAEPPVTMLCICLPAMLPLFRQIASKISPRFKPYSANGSAYDQKGSMRSKSGNFGAMSSSDGGVQMRSLKGSADRDKESLNSEGSWRGILHHGQDTTTSHVGVGGGGYNSAAHHDVPDRRIRVERNIHIDRHQQ